MNIYYRRDTGLEGFFSRMQSIENNVVVAPITDTEVKGDNPSMPATPLQTGWGYITGDINNQLDLIEKLQTLKKEIEEELTGQSATIFRYVGQVNTYEDLPKDAKSGDVYDVKDTGANYVFNGTEWDKLSENLDGFAKITDLNLFKQEVNTLLQELQTQITDNKTETDNTINDLKTQKLDKQIHEEYVEQNKADLQVVSLKMDELEKKVTAVKSLDAEVVVLYDGGDPEYSNKEKDFQLSGQVTAPTSILGNSITLKEVTLNASSLSLTAADEINIKDCTMDGLLPKKISEYILSCHADDFITFRNCTLTPESAYNGIEIGLNVGLTKCITIDNVNFDGHLINNAISIFGMADNGVLNITNCTFKDVANVLRISNRANTKFTINIINCICNKWTTGQYGGMITLHDYTSTSAEEADANNQFANLVINIQNVTKPDGTKIVPVDLSTICATGDDKQLIYMFDDYRGITAYGDKYPTINIL